MRTASAAARSWLIATLLAGLVWTNAGAVSVRVVVMVVVAVVVVALGVAVAVAVVVAVGRVALVLDERELVADATALVSAVVRLVALAEEDAVTVTVVGVLEPHAAISVASAVPSPSAVAVGKIFIGWV